MDKDTLERMMMDAAPLVEATALSKCDDGNWCFSFEDSLVVDVEMDEETSRMAFFADVGRLPEEGQNACMEMLLSYNYLWNVHGGLRVALDDSRQNVALIIDISVLDMTVQQLVQIISNFCTAANGWREHLADLVAEKASDEGIRGSDFRMASDLRV